MSEFLCKVLCFFRQDPYKRRTKVGVFSKNYPRRYMLEPHEDYSLPGGGVQKYPAGGGVQKYPAGGGVQKYPAGGGALARSYPQNDG